MRKRKLKRQTAKLIAIMYILYVVLADMAAVGGGLIRPKAADANIGNYEAYVSTSEGPGIRINTQTNGKVTTFNFNTVEGSRLQYSSYKIGVFSVKLDNKEYFYSAGSTYSETTPGLYYDNGSWKFVAPSEVEPSKLQVQLASRVEKFGTNSIDIYYPGYKGDISVCKDLLDTKLNGVVQLQCYGYDAKL